MADIKATLSLESKQFQDNLKNSTKQVASFETSLKGTVRGLKELATGFGIYEVVRKFTSYLDEGIKSLGDLDETAKRMGTTSANLRSVFQIDPALEARAKYVDQLITRVGEGAKLGLAKDVFGMDKTMPQKILSAVFPQWSIALGLAMGMKSGVSPNLTLDKESLDRLGFQTRNDFSEIWRQQQDQHRKQETFSASQLGDTETIRVLKKHKPQIEADLMQSQEDLRSAFGTLGLLMKEFDEAEKGLMANHKMFSPESVAASTRYTVATEKLNQFKPEYQAKTARYLVDWNHLLEVTKGIDTSEKSLTDKLEKHRKLRADISLVGADESDHLVYLKNRAKEMEAAWAKATTGWRKGKVGSDEMIEAAMKSGDATLALKNFQQKIQEGREQRWLTGRRLMLDIDRLGMSDSQLNSSLLADARVLMSQQPGGPNAKDKRLGYLGEAAGILMGLATRNKVDPWIGLTADQAAGGGLSRGARESNLAMNQRLLQVQIEARQLLAEIRQHTYKLTQLPTVSR